MGRHSFTVSSPSTPPLALGSPRLVRSVTDLLILILSRMLSRCFYLFYLLRTIVQCKPELKDPDLPQADDAMNAANTWSTTGTVGAGGPPGNQGPEVGDEATPDVVQIIVEDMPTHLLGSLHGILARHAA